jgi:hypothetical protein
MNDLKKIRKSALLLAELIVHFNFLLPMILMHLAAGFAAMKSTREISEPGIGPSS